MVNLIWGNKTDKSEALEEKKQFYKEKYQKLNEFPKLTQIQITDFIRDDYWTNKLFWGDNLEVLYFLLNDMAEKIDLIYIDPPFFSNSNYYINVESLDNNFQTIAYYDRWDHDLDSYLQMLYERIFLFKKLLSNKGLIFVHLDWHANHYVKLILDEIFGENRFVNNIVWYYYNKYSAGKKNLPRAHDDILVYSKSNNYTFNELRIPRKRAKKQLKRVNVNGVLKNEKDDNGHVIYRTVVDKKMDDVWKIPCLQPASKEWTGYPTQKHPELLERIIKLGSNENDVIADFFCGSGTTLVAAEKLNRKWIGCDVSEYSIYLSYRRLTKLLQENQGIKKKFYLFNIYTILTQERENFIKSGFFEKELKIKRKK